MSLPLAELSVEQLQRLRAQVGVGVQETIDALIREKSGAGALQPTTRRLSSVPLHLQREDDVEQDCEYWLDRLGFDVTSTSQKRRSKVTKGLPDRYIRSRKDAPHRLREFLEIKQPGGVVSEDQKRWLKAERDAGGRPMVVWSVQDLFSELRARGVSIPT
jgi:hypothetical protein